MNDNELKKFLIALGGIAEMSGLLRDRLLENGFTREEAVYMCTEVLKNMFTQKPQSNDR